MPPKLREYQPNDAQTLSALFDDFQDVIVSLDSMNRCTRPEGYGQAYLKRTLDDLQRHDGKFFIAEDGQHIIGFVCGKIERSDDYSEIGEPAETAGRITELYVDTNYRSKGLGHVLMNKIEQYFKKNKCSIIRVEVFAPNTKAHKFYHREGYTDRSIDLVKETK